MKPQTNRTTEPPSVYDDGSRSPGKSNPLQTRFILISMARLSVEEDDTIMTTMYSKFGFDGDFFVRNLNASVGWKQKRLHGEGRVVLFNSLVMPITLIIRLWVVGGENFIILHEYEPRLSLHLSFSLVTPNMLYSAYRVFPPKSSKSTRSMLLSSGVRA